MKLQLKTSTNYTYLWLITMTRGPQTERGTRVVTCNYVVSILTHVPLKGTDYYLMFLLINRSKQIHELFCFCEDMRFQNLKNACLLFKP